MPESVSLWDRTKQYSNTAYEKGLKPGFNKAYNVVNKLEKPVNRLTYKVGSESFWPGSLDKESEKAARILRSFCKDGFYDQIDEDEATRAEKDRRDLSENVPKGTVRVIKKIPASVIQNAKGLAIFTCMRTGWVIGGSGGAGVLVGRHPQTGEWSPPSGIHMQNLSVGFLGGVDFTDTVLVINSYEALDAFTKVRCTLGTEVGIAAGPIGIGGTIDTQVNKKPSPVWSYVKSRGVYGGVGVDGNVVIERTDENERFYGERVGVAKILKAELRYPPTEKYKVLMDTIRAAQGEHVSEELLPDGPPPGDLEMAPEGPTFGIPADDDPDPFGVKALEAEGLSIREAGTHRKASPEAFEFRPSPSSPVFSNYRQSLDPTTRRSWRASTVSINSIDRGTQTDEDELKSPRLIGTPFKDTDSKSIGTPRTVSPVPQESDEDGAGKEKKHVPDNSPKLDTSAAVVEKPALPPRKEEPEKLVIDTKNTPEAEVQNDHDKSSDDHADDESDDDFSDIEEVEIVTATPVTARPGVGVVNVPKRIPPPLPSRNPGRLSARSPLIGVQIDGFENVSLNEQLTAEDTAPKTNGQVEDPTTAANLAPGIQTPGEEFHSATPSPTKERKFDEVAESLR